MPNLLLARILKYYLIFISITPQRLTLKWENIVDSILYTLFLLLFESNIKNNKNIFLSNNLSSLLGQDKIKKSIWL